MAGQTLFDKIWQTHLVDQQQDGTCLLYIDRHLVHEVTSPQAFSYLRDEHHVVRKPKQTLAVADHNVPTDIDSQGVTNAESRIQIETLRKNCDAFGVPYIETNDKRRGIVHIIGPEQGFTLPGMTIVCGDSHTATHGAFGALAFGIGTSEVAHVLATQTLLQKHAKNMRISVDGPMPDYLTAKDIILSIIGLIGTAGGTGHVIEFAGDVIKNLSMEGRMTICNMAIEGGARAGLIAPDETTYKYLEGRPMAPQGDALVKAIEYWQSLHSDADAVYDSDITLHTSDIAPTLTWGTSPEDTVHITDMVPDISTASSPEKADAMKRALTYMGLASGTKMEGIKIDRAFIGSCTNGRIEDLRAAAAIAKQGKVAPHVNAMVVPGSGLVKEQAEKEGLDIIFKEAGFDWRNPGCSMCLAMNDDKLQDKQRCASTSNRNFEGRQGKGGRTHLMSPAMVAAAAISGHFVDIRKFL